MNDDRGSGTYGIFGWSTIGQGCHTTTPQRHTDNFEKLRERIQTDLNALGPDGHAIARKMRAKRIRGTPGEGDACPVFLYIAKRSYFPRRTHTIAVGGHIEVSTHDDHVDLVIEIPQPCQDFIARFDDGEYPDLIWTPKARAASA